MVKRRDARRGIAALCLGGGNGVALAVEMVSTRNAPRYGRGAPFFSPPAGRKFSSAMISNRRGWSPATAKASVAIWMKRHGAEMVRQPTRRTVERDPPGLCRLVTHLRLHEQQ